MKRAAPGFDSSSISAPYPRPHRPRCAEGSYLNNPELAVSSGRLSKDFPSTPRVLTALVLAMMSLWMAVPGRALAQSQDGTHLRPGDAVRLSVRDEPTLAGDYPIVQSGMVLLPVIGFVSAAERDFTDVGREVEERYGRILVRPEILLVPLLRIAVLGEVRSPGLFAVDPTQSLPDVIALAGGLTPSGDAERIAIVRDGAELRVRIATGEAEPVGGFRSGDQITVGRQGWARENLAAVVGAGASVLVAAMTALMVR
ncbi:MAG TPA: polysaccharide biosynthesis/export family protein [Longimicrobiaceae bacterium]|nr:polysaccharide biosynthesis/export family protein [Longimicrobiaceae bacterium]